MASLRNLLEGPTPRPLLYVGAPIAGVLLPTLFVFLGFPYDLFAPRLARQLSSATGSEIVIESIEPRITMAGPGMAARNVFVLRPDGASLSFDPLFVRPAWSTSWLRGDPSIHIDLRSEQGSVQGTILLALLHADEAINLRPVWPGWIPMSRAIFVQIRVVGSADKSDYNIARIFRDCRLLARELCVAVGGEKRCYECSNWLAWRSFWWRVRKIIPRSDFAMWRATISTVASVGRVTPAGR